MRKFKENFFFQRLVYVVPKNEEFTVRFYDEEKNISESVTLNFSPFMVIGKKLFFIF